MFKPKAGALRAAFVLALLSAPAMGRAATSNPAWRADFVQLKAALERSYVNLAWMGSPQSGIDVPGMERRARAALAAARTEDEARRALRDFVADFHDGHLSELSTIPTAQKTPVEPEPKPVTLDPADPATGCAALGYAANASAAFSLPFESLPGFALVADGLTEPFRAGVLPAPGGGMIGVVRIQYFRAKAFPSACLKGWAQLLADKRPITPGRVGRAARRQWFAALAERLAALKARGVKAVVVDVGANNGGDDSGDWAARLFTNQPVHSARLLMVAGPPAAAYFDDQMGDLSETLGDKPGEEAVTALNAATAFFKAQKAGIAAASCDLSWVWREQRPWRLQACNRLVQAGFAGGALADLPKDAYGDSDVAGALSSPSLMDDYWGAWTGKTYVLTNEKTYSSAEMFAAVMKDNGVARTVGVKTGGDGCGFMTETPPLILTHTGLRFRIPNCIRLRADGTDEVAGVAPDIPVSPVEGESDRARAMRLLRLIDAGVTKP